MKRREHLIISYLQENLVRVEVKISATPRTALVLDDVLNGKDALGYKGTFGTPLRGKVDDLYPYTLKYQGVDLQRNITKVYG